MEYIIIGLVALFASALTFFSGFGLGTILTPVFLLFLPLEIAIALTAVVHFLNNLFKIALIGKYIHFGIGILFGLTGIAGAFIGAKFLFTLSRNDQTLSFQIFGQEFTTTLLQIIIALLLAFFALVDLLPKLRQLRVSRNFAIPGGLLSGFFGGLSGHQGALRSVFLLRFGLQKEAFIATGILIACCIDITRLGIYWSELKEVSLSDHLPLLLTALLSAFAGAVAGNMLLKKITLKLVHTLVGAMILAISILLGLGLL